MFESLCCPLDTLAYCSVSWILYKSLSRKFGFSWNYTIEIGAAQGSSVFMTCIYQMNKQFLFIWVKMTLKKTQGVIFVTMGDYIKKPPWVQITHKT